MKLVNRIHRRIRINRVVRELSALNDDILRDIGVERGNIHELVEQMVDANTRANMTTDTLRREPFVHPGLHVRGGATA